VNVQWSHDTIIIVAAYPRSALNKDYPTRVCADKVATRTTIVKVVIVLGVVMIVAAVVLYWRLFGFIYDPHV
jgi:hypothetical protein